MARILLDTSALLCHYFDEPGAARVDELLAGDEVMVSAPSEFEFIVVACSRGAKSSDAMAAFSDYADLMVGVVPITSAVARRALGLRLATGSRIPTVDCLIAGAAAESECRLVHKDRHFSTIPAELLEQEVL